MMWLILQIFKECDTDGSESIEAEEMQTFLKKLGHNLSEAESKELFAKIDTDGGGSISFFELLNNAPEWLIGEELNSPG